MKVFNKHTGEIGVLLDKYEFIVKTKHGMYAYPDEKTFLKYWKTLK